MPDPIFALPPVSGYYVRRTWLASPSAKWRTITSDTLRLDVDRDFPLMRASGLAWPNGPFSVLGEPVYWISDQLAEVGSGVWEATIRRRYPETVPPEQSALPQSKVRIEVTGRALSLEGRKATVTFSGGGAAAFSTTLTYESPYFREAEFEFDFQYCTQRVMAIDTGAHPERPATLPVQTLTVKNVYSRAGIDLQTSPHVAELPEEPFDTVWSDQELHDAMTMYWSYYQAQKPWAGWLLFAQYYVDPDVFGIMFDNPDLGPGNRIQRQGAAVFVRTLWENIPHSLPHREAHLQRRTFFSAIHELGHCFNLGHSWEKHAADPWIPLNPDEKAFSIMNYPEGVEGFWKYFEYRFSDAELYFLRHAPEEFVAMGGEAGKDHGYRSRDHAVELDPRMTLEIAVDRERRLFEFLEPVVLDLKLTNSGDSPIYVDPAIFRENHALQLAIRPRHGLAVGWRPYVTRCILAEPRLLSPGQSIEASAFVSAGIGGWYLAEPGAYSLEARIDTEHGAVFAAPLDLRIAMPRHREEELVAQDFFTDEVGRALALGGTRVMGRAIESLTEVTEDRKSVV